MTTVYMKKKQGGLAVITLVIATVILLGVLMAMVASSRTTSSTGDQTAKLLAAAIIDQGNLQRVGFDLKLAEGNDITTIEYNNSTNGLFNSLTGTTVKQLPPGDAIGTGTASAHATAKGRWLFASPTVGTGISNQPVGIKTLTATNSSYAVVLSGVRESVCKQINAATRNYTPTSEIPLFGTTLLTGGAVGDPDRDYVKTQDLDLTTVTMTGVIDRSTGIQTTAAGLDGYVGCFKPVTGIADNNIFFNIVKPL